MPLTDHWLPNPWTPGLDGLLFDVYRYTAGVELEFLPALEYLGSAEREGGDPGTCMLRYNLNRPAYDEDAPRAAEEALSKLALTSFDEIAGVGTLAQVVESGDRIAVTTTRPDGIEHWVFDGVALDFQLEWADGVEEVRILCVGIAHRLNSIPIQGQYQRHAGGTGPADDVLTDLVLRFNPDGLPNCFGDDAPAANGVDPPQEYPPFSDPLVSGELWTLERAARYLLYHHNPIEEFVENPSALALGGTLVAYEPVEGEVLDILDPATYTRRDLIARDAPMTGRGLLSALKDLIGAHGFALQILLIGEEVVPRSQINIFHTQTRPPVDLYLQPRGTVLDGTLTNVGSCQLGRDLREIATVIRVQGALERWECSLILKPAFPSAAADAADGDALKVYTEGHPDFDAHRNDYRTYVLAEAPGEDEGWYEPGESTLHPEATSLDSLFGAPAPTPQYVHRRRPAIGDLVSRGAAGEPLKAQLWISTDYTGPGPGLWDGTGTWQQCSGGWELLRDRCGIRLTVKNPNAWTVGKSEAAGVPYPNGVVKGVEDQALSGSTRFTLRLTCVLEADRVVSGLSPRRTTAPLTYDVERLVDRRDQYRYEAVAAGSQFNADPSVLVKRDDAPRAQADAESIRQALDCGLFEGSVTIPYYTRKYEIGDRIRSIDGRNLGLRTDGGDAATTPVLPVVVGIQWSNQGGQHTTLQLSDAATSRQTYRRRNRR